MITIATEYKNIKIETQKTYKVKGDFCMKKIAVVSLIFSAIFCHLNLLSGKFYSAHL